jgi:hypothetical protein
LARRPGTPFGHIKGPFYVYILARIDPGPYNPIYVGRGRSWRALAYYAIGPRTRSLARYLHPATHNPGLNAEIAAIRARRSHNDVAVRAVDCGKNLARSKRLEKRLILKYGRLDLKTGTLHNRNAGG